MTRFALENHFSSLKTLPHQAIATLPTPVEHADALGTALGLHHLYIKRDDQTGELYGGNKVRKLAFLLGEALEEGATDILTIGAMGSNHVLATSLYARHLGLAPAAQHFEQPVTEHVLNNLLALSTTQPELKLMGHPAQLPFHMFKKKVQDWMAQKKNTYYIPGGGSSGMGSLGYVDAALELRNQIDDGQLPEPDVIFVTAGTCGTIAGLALGLKIAGLKSKIHAVRVVDRVVANPLMVLKLVHQMKGILNTHGVHDLPDVTRNDIYFIHDHLGKDYGYPTKQGLLAIETMKAHCGLKLEPTYTGKTFGALMAMRQSLRLADKNVLYWHTLSGIDLTPLVEKAKVTDLPEAYHHFFNMETP